MTRAIPAPPLLLITDRHGASRDIVDLVALASTGKRKGTSLISIQRFKPSVDDAARLSGDLPSSVASLLR